MGADANNRRGATMKWGASFAACIAVVLSFTAASAAELTPEEQAEVAKYTAILKSLHPQTGDVPVPAAKVVLHLDKGYYFLPPEDAKRVLVDGWGNPPGSASGALGLIFPSGKTFLDDTWGAVVSYEPSGFVTDKDADSANYTELLRQMQSGEKEGNERRVKDGFRPMHLVGWAEPPSYDHTTHTVIWAQDLAIGDPPSPEYTLNYDLRVLGRHGVLSMNLISAMSRLPTVRADAAQLRQVAMFDKGADYAAFDAKTDKLAGYGVAGLVAAGLGLAVAKKAGLVALLLIFAKKGFVIILAAGGAIAAWFRRAFGRKPAKASSRIVMDDRDGDGPSAA